MTDGAFREKNNNIQYTESTYNYLYERTTIERFNADYADNDDLAMLRGIGDDGNVLIRIGGTTVFTRYDRIGHTNPKQFTMRGR
jgi:hypothetical protein